MSSRQTAYGDVAACYAEAERTGRQPSVAKCLLDNHTRHSVTICSASDTGRERERAVMTLSRQCGDHLPLGVAASLVKLFLFAPLGQDVAVPTSLLLCFIFATVSLCWSLPDLHNPARPCHQLTCTAIARAGKHAPEISCTRAESRKKSIHIHARLAQRPCSISVTFVS